MRNVLQLFGKKKKKIVTPCDFMRKILEREKKKRTVTGGGSGLSSNIICFQHLAGPIGRLIAVRSIRSPLTCTAVM